MFHSIIVLNLPGLANSRRSRADIAGNVCLDYHDSVKQLFNSLRNTFFRFTDGSLQSQAGQVGLVILLIMSGMLAVALSLAARTTQELVLTEQEKDSVRVFNAAEEGVERALSTDLNFSGESTGDIEFGVEGIDESVFANVAYSITKKNNLETVFFEGVSLAVDVTGVTTGQSLKIEWSREDNCSTDDPASLIIAIFSVSGGATQVRYEGIGACDRSDGFTLASSINNGYRREYNLPLLTNDFLVRIRAVYNDTYGRVTGVGLTLPVQYYAIRSQAYSTTGNETRVVEVNRTLNTAPSIFDYAVYSGTTLVK